jgi:ribosomal protein S14
MARKALKVKQAKLLALREKCWKEWKPMPMPTKFYNRCQLTGRAGAYIWDFWVCRQAFRRLARHWLIVWLRKASW